MGFRGAEPNMTVQELGEYWMRRRREEARAPSTGERRGAEEGAVSLQTLAGYQNALSRIINPRLGGLRLTEARTGVVDEALTRVDLSGRTTRVARSVLAQMFAMAVRHDALAFPRCARSGGRLGDDAQSTPSPSSKPVTCFG